MDILKLLPRRFYTLDGVTYLLTNLSVAVNASTAVKNADALFLRYIIKDGETARDLAERLYDNRDLYWTVYMLNGMVNHVNDWPMSSGDLYEQSLRTWGYEGMDAVVGYADDSGNLVDIPGIRYQYGLEDDSPDDITVAAIYNLTPVTRFELFEMENESKRNIKMLDPRYIDQFLDSVRKEIQ